MAVEAIAEAGVVAERPRIAELTAPLCKAGKHPHTLENRAKGSGCKMCLREYQREYYQRTHVLKGKPHKKWDGTLEHLFALGWIQIEGEHWMWRHSVNKVSGRPTMRWNQKTQYPVTLVWELTEHASVPKDHVLMHDLSRCNQKLCVSPEHHRVVKRGEHVSQEDRAKGHRMQHERFAARSLDAEIEKLIVRDETGCWKWTGPHDRKRKDGAHLTFLKEYINVRKYLWTKINGELPKKHLLQHQADVGCSHSKQCVRPEHMRIVSLQEQRTAARYLDVEIEKRIVRDETGCWKWVGPIQKSKGGAHLKFLKKYINVRKYIWTQIKGDIPEKHLLQHQADVGCSHPMECVCPEHMRIISLQHRRTAARSLDAEIEKLIVRDETGCWKWTGYKRRSRPSLMFLEKCINVRKYLWTRINGELPKKRRLKHKEDLGCSHPMECVCPEHIRIIRMSTLRIAGHEWPGTFWEPDSKLQCENCRRSFEWHGTDECTARKLGLPLNQRHRACKPKSADDAEKRIAALRGNRGKESVAHTPQPKRQAVIPPIENLEFKRQERANPPPNNRVLKISVAAVEPDGQERKHAEEPVRVACLPECSCPKCAPPRLTARSKSRPASKFICLHSLQCRISGTELRSEILYCVYCGLPRTADGRASAESNLERFAISVSEETDES